MDPIPSPDNPAQDPDFAARSGRCSSARSGVPREAMRVAAFIVRRMALDMREIEGEWGYVEPWHLHQRGWSPEQVMLYGKLASAEAGRGAAIDQQLAAGHGQFAFIAKPGPIFTRTERTLFSLIVIGALALGIAGMVEIARPGTLPAFNAAAIQPAPQAGALPVCRPEGA